MTRITAIDRHDVALHLQLLGLLDLNVDVDLGLGLGLRGLGLGLLGGGGGGGGGGGVRSTKHVSAAARQALVHQYRVQCGVSFQAYAGAVAVRAATYDECVDVYTERAGGCARDDMVRD
jgi:hypothetical protein